MLVPADDPYYDGGQELSEAAQLAEKLRHGENCALLHLDLLTQVEIQGEQDVFGCWCTSEVACHARGKVVIQEA